MQIACSVTHPAFPGGEDFQPRGRMPSCAADSDEALRRVRLIGHRRPRSRKASPRESGVSYIKRNTERAGSCARCYGRVEMHWDLWLDLLVAEFRGASGVRRGGRG